MANNSQYRMDAEEEALMKAYPYALYFVQSPNSTTGMETGAGAGGLPLSRCTSSHASNNSFLHEKKIVIAGGGGDDIHDLEKDGKKYDDHDDEENHEEMMDLWERYLSFRKSSSLGWICLQLFWRFVLSLGLALIVFFIATKPPPPIISIQVTRIGEFRLGEGVDGSGVSTKILNLNCSIKLMIDNKSKLFGLHIYHPSMEMSFDNLPIALNYGENLYATARGETWFELNLGTENKAMYGAGRAMEDMLETKKELPLVINFRVNSFFKVVWDLIKPRFHHQARCLLVLSPSYDKKRRTQVFTSTCLINSS
ncbi:uncharacterized protein LOC124942669 [Impatiens glandulifera]|uniref:uncharacterized protein LOC124942669 n=1 Tax=Impatiens glandulifera TaxID=253017 RepID=UPI001FB0E621|nr:uncharacterized protein LOC124942669 [Impatiens glandulifera]